MSLKNKLLNILSFGVYKKILKIDNYNINYFNNLDFDKRFHYEKLKDPNKKSLLVIARFNQNGGIEKRQVEMLKYLEKHYNIFILSYVDAFNYSQILLNKNYFVYLSNITTSKPATLEQYIRRIITYHEINYVEIHFGHILNINYKNLKIGKSKLIGHIHSSLSFYKKDKHLNNLLSNINDFDVVIKVKSNDIDIIHQNIHIIPNGIEESKNIYLPNKSNKCLIVSRLDKDKFVSIKSIIDFASKNNIDVDIAGISTKSKGSEDFKSNALKEFTNIKINFLGSIETTSYLKENSNKYLFVGGVSLVIFEALSLGFPALQADDHKLNFLTFINKDNFSELYKKNFQELEENTTTLKQDLLSIKNGDIKKFILEQERDEMLISKLVGNYKEILDRI